MMATIDELFHITYGQKEYHNKGWLDGNTGNGILVSSKGEDNGVYGFYDIPTKFKAPFITVQGYGTIGHAFVQEIDCSVDDHMLVLTPKRKMELSQLFQVAFQIRSTKWKYKYGRGITPTRLKNQKVELIDYQKQMESLEKEITPTLPKKVQIRKVETAKPFRLDELFAVIKGKGSYLETLSEGYTPIVTTQMSDNGVCGFYDIKPSFEKLRITVGRIMCNPHVQLANFSTVPDDLFVLTPIKPVIPEFLFYVSSIIQTEAWRFNYCRKVTKEKLEALNILLPTDNKSEIDYEYIKQLAINTYGYSSLEGSL